MFTISIEAEYSFNYQQLQSTHLCEEEVILHVIGANTLATWHRTADKAPNVLVAKSFLIDKGTTIFLFLTAEKLQI